MDLEFYIAKNFSIEKKINLFLPEGRIESKDCWGYGWTCVGRQEGDVNRRVSYHKSMLTKFNLISTLITRIFSESKTYNGYASIISNYVMKGYPIAKTLSVMGTCIYKIYWPTDLSGSQQQNFSTILYKIIYNTIDENFEHMLMSVPTVKYPWMTGFLNQFVKLKKWEYI